MRLGIHFSVAFHLFATVISEELDAADHECFEDLDHCGCEKQDYLEVSRAIEEDRWRSDSRRDVENTLRYCGHTNCQNHCNTTRCEAVRKKTNKERQRFRDITRYRHRDYMELLNEMCDRTSLITSYDDVVTLGHKTVQGQGWTDTRRSECQAELEGCDCDLAEFEKQTDEISNRQYIDSDYMPVTMNTCMHMNCVEKCGTSRVCKTFKWKSLEARRKLKERADNGVEARMVELCETANSTTLQENTREVHEMDKNCNLQLRECGCGIDRYTSFLKKLKEGNLDDSKNRQTIKAKRLMRHCAFVNCIEGCENDCQFNVTLFAKSKEIMDGLNDNKTIARCKDATMESAFKGATDNLNGSLGFIILCSLLLIQ